jgi:hypothetical protein
MAIWRTKSSLQLVKIVMLNNMLLNRDGNTEMESELPDIRITISIAI